MTSTRTIDIMMRFTALFVAGTILPFILLFIIALTGFSEVIEEAAKLLAIWFLARPLPSKAWQLGCSAVFGFVFACSESALYAGQLIAGGASEVLLQRLLLTTPMHIATSLIICVFSWKGRGMALLGLVVSIALHLAFNMR